jgi:hypothetical protein
MYYMIRIQGHLDPSWQDRFGGLCIEQQETGTTLLSGMLPDQAALHGVLLQVVRLGLTLLSLETSKSKDAIRILNLGRDTCRNADRGFTTM